MSFELEFIMLGKVSQPQKDKAHMFSLMWELERERERERG
jgi:hypothetical protein